MLRHGACFEKLISSVTGESFCWALKRNRGRIRSFDHVLYRPDDVLVVLLPKAIQLTTTLSHFGENEETILNSQAFGTQ
jgi:hypothetical protein